MDGYKTVTANDSEQETTSLKTNKLIIQEGKKDYGEEAAEDTKKTSQGNDEFDGGDK